MINKVGIESRVLAPTRKDGEDTLAKLRSAGSAWTLGPIGGFIVTRYAYVPSPINGLLLSGCNVAAKEDGRPFRWTSEERMPCCFLEARLKS